MKKSHKKHRSAYTYTVRDNALLDSVLSWTGFSFTERRPGSSHDKKF